MNTATIIEIRKKVKKSIDRADDTTVKMILAMLEVQEKETEEETEFEKEIQQRFEEYEQGKIIPLTLDEFETGIEKIRKKGTKESEKESVLNGIKQAVEEVKLVKAGKLKTRSLKDLLDEI